MRIICFWDQRKNSFGNKYLVRKYKYKYKYLRCKYKYFSCKYKYKYN